MKTCPACRSSVSPGASDCAVCGQLLVLAGNEGSFIKLLRERYPLVAGVVHGLLVSAWVLFASTWLFWVYPVALGASLVVGWALSRVQQSSRALAVMFSIPLLVAVWFWAWADADPDFGNLVQWLATWHAVLVLVAFSASRVVRRGDTKD